MLKVPGAVPTGANRSKLLTSQLSQSRLNAKDRSVTVGVASRTTLNSSSRKSQVALDNKVGHGFGGKINTMIQVYFSSFQTIKQKNFHVTCIMHGQHDFNLYYSTL